MGVLTFVEKRIEHQSQKGAAATTLNLAIVAHGLIGQALKCLNMVWFMLKVQVPTLNEPSNVRKVCATLETTIVLGARLQIQMRANPPADPGFRITVDTALAPDNTAGDPTLPSFCKASSRIPCNSMCNQVLILPEH